MMPGGVFSLPDMSVFQHSALNSYTAYPVEHGYDER